MNKPAHLMGGLTAGIAVLKNIESTVPQIGLTDAMVSGGVVLCGALLGSLLPDIDHRNSYIGRKLKVASFIISKTLGHRSVIHTPLVIFAFSALLYFFSKELTGQSQVLSSYFIMGLSAGMWSHLLLDMMTRRGIPLLYPITKKSFRIANFKGGGMGDTISIIGCAILIVFLLK
ncbi:hypothetical protein D1B33_01085 [Lysinibacillus yapensis]|uniref:Metal-dependent hydrolase n=1 Tax=Ureibacillus yapensis TaxID=2304605 RepID=A0A396SGR5_9BACL|nr:metal-dependent hydrolase [Lysinibacillus yapensis]RHW39468.1 hypothetical protein D1B33_01085 [Lysinibacillus yapensis]